ncbi:MAG: GTPase [Gemmataceae bacterium]
MTRVAVLTPPGTGAIATVAVIGPMAWAVVKERFRPAAGKPLPDSLAQHRTWFGALGDGAGDEVVVAVRAVEPEPWVEVHCHGGRQVVRWVVEQFVSAGCEQVSWQEVAKPTPSNGWAFDLRALEPLTHAPTQRTANILLDQYHGAFAREVEALLADNDLARLQRLHALGPVGRHLVEPWRVVIAGPPNVGKSSLVNALAGFQRSVVAPVAGTTRDVVTTTVAFDGWPVELADTAGLRKASESLEAAGVGRAKDRLASADLVVWVMDATDPTPTPPDRTVGASAVVVASKADQPAAWDVAARPEMIAVSALTGAGLTELIAEIVRRLVPATPAPGEAVPFTPDLADLIATAADGAPARVRELLTTCLPG